MTAVVAITVGRTASRAGAWTERVSEGASARLLRAKKGITTQMTIMAMTAKARMRRGIGLRVEITESGTGSSYVKANSALDETLCATESSLLAALLSTARELRVNVERCAKGTRWAGLALMDSLSQGRSARLLMLSAEIGVDRRLESQSEGWTLCRRSGVPAFSSASRRT
ncbi:hypothetical protein [Tahibacter amnicola]|uniref:Uncharacterized protein n=1 Tax=Tahibacter amnicola TaxID=2976241 RepID=A0ABY6BFX3_9GAMM|nr:hypothetical protein [Tahibacter amnicola]UXI68730.1 hypothetical protein N4264_03495 [Tahibacter amnicola]